MIIFVFYLISRKSASDLATGHKLSPGYLNSRTAFEGTASAAQPERREIAGFPSTFSAEPEGFSRAAVDPSAFL